MKLHFSVYIRLTLAFLLLPPPAWTAGGGTSAGTLLTIPGESRGAAMAGAYSAAANDVTGLWYNPATIVRSPRATASLLHLSHVEGISANALGLVLPVFPKVNAGLSAQVLRVGSIPKLDNTGTEEGTFEPQDVSLGLAIAKRLDRTSLGLALKAFRTTIDETAMAFATDLGVHHEWGAFSAALAAQNFGTGIQFHSQSNPLPQTIRLGTSLTAGRNFLFNLDLIHPNDSSTGVALGTEFTKLINNEMAFALRGGYTTLYKSDLGSLAGITTGMGFAFRDVGVNYAFIPFGELGFTHRLSIVFEMASPIVKERSGANFRYEEGYGNVIARQKQFAKVEYYTPVEHRVKPPAGNPIPWKNKKQGQRATSDRIMELLSKDALCPIDGPHGILSKLKGLVFLKQNPLAKKGVRIGANRYLFEGETVETDPQARAQLVLANGSETEMDPDTSITFNATENVCEYPNIVLNRGRILTRTPANKNLKITTPYGYTEMGQAECALQSDQDGIQMEVLSGEASFHFEGSSVTLKSGDVYARKRPQSGTETPEGNAAMGPRPTPYFPPAKIPGRWDKKATEEVRTELERLEEIGDVKVGEYIRDKQVRDELTVLIHNLNVQKGELETQLEGYKDDIESFASLRDLLTQAGPNETGTERKERRRNLKNAREALENAQTEFANIKQNLETILNDLKINKRFLATLAIVRMVNISATEATIPFRSGKASLDEEAYSILDKIAASIEKLQPKQIIVEGHTDKVGTPQGNKRLSKRRARRVARYLRKKSGISWLKFSVRGRGDTQPLIEGEDINSLAQNRRVEIWMELEGL